MLLFVGSAMYLTGVLGLVYLGYLIKKDNQ